ncbi:hypothetical protein [Caballeronia cordobensis]|uniref:hypothetical protein n=1 Tax=Caballeronia cordobensis TaxID=1353886 RepID=UPI00135745A6|nr:hypothetical protein [Caballeronia cordobensis]
MLRAAAAGFTAPAPERPRFVEKFVEKCVEKRAADSIPEGRSREPVDEPTHYV